MTSIGFIGSGQVGSTVARLAVSAGYDVVLSNSRDPATLDGLVADLGPRARAATSAEAAADGDMAVVSVPFRAYGRVPAAPLAGKTVIDTTTYHPQRDGQYPELNAGFITVPQLVQQHLAASRVVTALSNVFVGHMASLARPSGAGDRSALAIAGDDASAKAEVTGFLDRIGYDALDAGALVESRRFRTDTPAYGVPHAGGTGAFSAAVSRPAVSPPVASRPVRPVGARQLRDRLSAAGRRAGPAGRRPPGDGF